MSNWKLLKESMRCKQCVAGKQKRRNHYGDVGIDTRTIILKQISKHRACEVGASDLG